MASNYEDWMRVRIGRLRRATMRHSSPNAPQRAGAIAMVAMSAPA
jgi:hypothetical protein